MQLVDRMCENVVEWIDGEEKATVTYSSRYAGKLKRLKEKCPDDVEIIAENKDGSICGRVPLKFVSVRRPPRRILTDEQRREASERMKATQLRLRNKENDAISDFYDEDEEILDEEN